MNSEHKDIVIVGGGAVGMLMALALAKSGRKIFLIEKLAISNAGKQENRSIALSYSSVCVLRSLGIWQKIENAVQFINQVHVSDKGQYGQTNLYAQDEGLAFLGVVVKMTNLLSVMYELVTWQTNIVLYQDSEVMDLYDESDSFSLIVSTNGFQAKITANLIIAADGAKSRLRAKAGIKVSEHCYGQSALIFDLFLQRSHGNIAYERFINNGVMAMLPVADKQMACVWSVDHTEVEYWHKQNKEQILKEVQRLFGYRLGRFIDMTKLKTFPLSLIQAKSLYHKNLLLFGNAVHLLHPISGQGLNLSIRDIGILYDLLTQENTLTATKMALMLHKYESLRAFDHKRTAMLTHSMVHIFKQEALSIKLARSTFLHLMERDQFLKNTLSKLMMGKYNQGSTLMFGNDSV